MGGVWGNSGEAVAGNAIESLENGRIVGSQTRNRGRRREKASRNRRQLRS